MFAETWPDPLSCIRTATRRPPDRPVGRPDSTARISRSSNYSFIRSFINLKAHIHANTGLISTSKWILTCRSTDVCHRWRLHQAVLTGTTTILCLILFDLIHFQTLLIRLPRINRVKIPSRPMPFRINSEANLFRFRSIDFFSSTSGRIGDCIQISASRR